jgi:hypothetical protein
MRRLAGHLPGAETVEDLVREAHAPMVKMLLMLNWWIGSRVICAALRLHQ